MSSDEAASLEVAKFKLLLQQAGGDLGLAAARMSGKADQDALSELKAQSDLKVRLAALRWIDQTLYSAMFLNLPAAPAFSALTDLSPWLLPDRLVGQGDGRFGWAGGAALRWDLDWKGLDAMAHSAWHLQLAGYFAKQANGNTSLDQLYHTYRSDEDQAVAMFVDAFDQAGAKFDIPGIHAVLQTVKDPPPTIGGAMWKMQRANESYFAGLSQFRRDYQLTHRFFQRDAAFESFNKTFEASDKWIWHIHASGGVGKTTFLRWLITRHLLPRPDALAICAKVDFDDFRLNRLVERPLLAICEVVRQIERQLPDRRLQTILLDLERAAQEPGWNDQWHIGVQQQLTSQPIETPVVVVLDTLEDAFRTQLVWLARVIEEVGKLRTGMPHLKLVLSGRHDLSPALPDLLSAMTVFELERFNETEAQSYLEEVEEIARADLRQAMLDRVLVEDDPQQIDVKRYNPFKLSLIAEIVRGDSGMTVETIANMQSVAIAYLIERVILRIPGQPLRWLIRYAVVARELDQPFLEAVLLPELRKVMDGSRRDDKVLQYSGQDVWIPDPEGAKRLNGADLINELRGYARDRGWISVDTGSTVIRLHPEVVDPCRHLLAGQKVYLKLHRRALKYASSLVQEAVNADDWCAAKSMQLFHVCELDESQGAVAWRKAMKEAEKFGRNAVEKIASELNNLPTSVRHVISMHAPSEQDQLQCEAELKIAKVRIEEAFQAGSENFELRSAIVAHIERAISMAPDLVDPAYAEVVERLSRSTEMPVEALSEPLPPMVGDIDKLAPVYCHLAFAWRLGTLRGRKWQYRAIEQVELARRALGRRKLLSLTDAQLALKLATMAAALSDVTSAKWTLSSVRVTRGGGLAHERARALVSADVALLDHDLLEAKAQIKTHQASGLLKPHESDYWVLHRLKLDLALAANLPLKDLRQLAEDNARIGGDPIVRIEILCRAGFAAGLLFGFDSSEEYFRNAENLIESTQFAATAGMFRELQRWRLRTVLRGNRHPNKAERLLQATAINQRGNPDPDQIAELAGFSVWAALLKGDALSAGALLPEPEVLAEAAPGTRWALALTTIGIADPSRISELVEILEGPLPATSELYLALERLADRRAQIPEGLFDIEALLSRLPKINWLSPSAAIDKICQADLFRVLGRKSKARKLVYRDFKGRPTEDNILTAIDWARCRGRLGLRSDVERLRKDVEDGSPLSATARGLKAAIDVLNGQQAATDLAWDAARSRALEGRRHFWEQREASGWSQRIWEIAALADVKLADNDARHLSRALQQQLEVGLWPLPGLDESPAETVSAVDHSWLRGEILGNWDTHFSRARVWDRSAIGDWVSFWRSDPASMRNDFLTIPGMPKVPAGARVDLAFDTMLSGTLASALPWELSNALESASVIRRSGLGEPRILDTEASPDIEDTIAIMANMSMSTPDRGRHLWESYQRNLRDNQVVEINPNVSHVYNSDIFTARSNVRVVHVLAELQDVKGGYALSFSDSTTNSPLSFNSQDLFTSRHLQPMLSGLRSRPLVILDIISPENEVAAAEMLLQRNALAHELYDPWVMCGLIATGLAPVEIRQDLVSRMIKAIAAGGTVGEVFASTRRSPFDPERGLAHYYWPRATALWCANADDPVLGKGIPW